MTVHLSSRGRGAILHRLGRLPIFLWGSLGIFGWGKEDHNGQIFSDVKEAMFLLGWHKENGPGFHQMLFVARPERPLAADNVEHFIFGMGLLRIDSARCK